MSGPRNGSAVNSEKAAHEQLNQATPVEASNQSFVNESDANTLMGSHLKSDRKIRPEDLRVAIQPSDPMLAQNLAITEPQASS